MRSRSRHATRYVNEVRKAANHIRRETDAAPDVTVIAGSGLGRLAELVSVEKRLPYSSIPHYPQLTVAGHRGEMIVGRVGEKRVAVLSGRRHLYEKESGAEGEEPGDSWAWRIVFPVRVLAELGVRTLIVTNAAGALNANFEIGDLMLISDHINLAFRNPLIGAHVSTWGARFPDMSEPYAKELREIARRIARAEGIVVKEGVYVWMLGPSYETRAEVEMLRLLGADAVGMSTVPETLAAVQCGMRVLGISFISNSLVKDVWRGVSHAEVLATASRVEKTMLRFLKVFIQSL